jgi:hypothetical protein
MRLTSGIVLCGIATPLRSADFGPQNANCYQCLPLSFASALYLHEIRTAPVASNNEVKDKPIQNHFFTGNIPLLPGAVYLLESCYIGFHG